MNTHEDEDRIIKYDDSPEAKERVYQIALKWCHQLGYSGETFQQSDKAWEKGPCVLTELAEEGFKFEVKYKE